MDRRRHVPVKLRSRVSDNTVGGVNLRCDIAVIRESQRGFLIVYGVSDLRKNLFRNRGVAQNLRDHFVTLLTNIQMGILRSLNIIFIKK